MPDHTTALDGTPRPGGTAARPRETEVDGVRTVLAARPPRPGALSAGLAFRVGTADETYATHGITHLVEHLALHRQGVTDVHYNGATGAAFTVFHVEGTAEEIVSYLNGVCSSLRDLPLDRLETEREILRTEASGRSHGPNQHLPLWRYGARGYGLTSYGELGSWHLTADAVREWAATRFTRGNAVLWIGSDTVPDGLEITLPEGRALPAPPPTSALPATPAWIRGDDGVVVADGVVPRSTAATVFAEVLGRALFTDLRQEGGYSYSATAHYAPRDGAFATVTAFADALPKKQDAVVGGFVDVLARLRAGRIGDAELDSARGRLLKAHDSRENDEGEVVVHAMNLLMGHRNTTREQLRAEIRAVTAADLRDVARAWYATALLQVPGRGAEWAGFTEAPQYSTVLVTGTRHRSLESADHTLIVAPEGVSLTAPGGPTTVLFHECAAMVAYPDGGRFLTGSDGFRVSVEPTLYAGLTPARLAVIDRAVDSAAVVRMPARSPEQIPVPRAAEQHAPSAAQRLGRSAGALARRLFAAGWYVAAAVLGAGAVVASWQELVAPEPEWTTPAVLWLLCVFLVLRVVAGRTARMVTARTGRRGGRRS